MRDGLRLMPPVDCGREKNSLKTVMSGPQLLERRAELEHVRVHVEARLECAGLVEGDEREEVHRLRRPALVEDAGRVAETESQAAKKLSASFRSSPGSAAPWIPEGLPGLSRRRHQLELVLDRLPG
jgi:hypothetical protein